MALKLLNINYSNIIRCCILTAANYKQLTKLQ